MKEFQPSLKKIIQPYLFISIAGLMAFAPISFMLRAFKNDIIALEYPINHFISQCIRNGEIPYWFNTWGMGFPLQSNLTWGIFSTPQILFSSLFDYNIYILHIEFMFFVLLSGWSMFHLLQKHILKDQKISQLLAICYMLSGFMVGSTQWLLYITAAAFIPLVVGALLQLLKTPTYKHAIQFSIIYTLMFTSVYAAFNIITTYSLLLFLLYYFLLKKFDKTERHILIRFLFITGATTVFLCFPCLYYTVELLQYIDRGNSIASDTTFFNSNYLHPAALSNLLFPFSSVRMNFSNTEGTMLSSYIGLFTIIIFPAAIKFVFNEKKWHTIILLLSSILFLFISFGDITPLRKAINILPGFSYFRNPAIFRLYFIFSIILFIAIVFQNFSFERLVDFKQQYYGKVIKYTLLTLIAISVIVLFTNVNQITSFTSLSLAGFSKNVTYSQTLFINASIQLGLLLFLFFTIWNKYQNISRLILTFDLVINTLLCTPFYSVSSYTLPELEKILKTEKGFPVQNLNIGDVPAIFTDIKNNTWNNVNIFKKQVTSNESYRGPLTLRQFSNYSNKSSDSLKNIIAFFLNEKEISRNQLKLLIQKPTYIKFQLELKQPENITILQNYYPGWKAYYNGKKVNSINYNNLGMSILAPQGSGIVEFKYERIGVWVSAFLLHLLVIIYFGWHTYNFFKRKTK